MTPAVSGCMSCDTDLALAAMPPNTAAAPGSIAAMLNPDGNPDSLARVVSKGTTQDGVKP